MFFFSFQMLSTRHIVSNCQISRLGYLVKVSQHLKQVYTVHFQNHELIRRYCVANSAKPTKYFDLNDLIKTVNITYKTGKEMDQITTVESKYVDVNNVPDTKGTVVTLSGSPGTHNDFKYMKSLFEEKNIRMICTNYPGSEFVTGGFHNSYTNEDRNSYMKSLMETLHLQKVNRLIIMGHSRGGENALQLTSQLSDSSSWPLVGAVMINSPGFAPHKGISKRMGTINFIISLIKRHNNTINAILHPILHWFYNNVIGLRVSHGKVAAAAILPMQTFAFDQQKQSIDDLRQKPRIQVFYGYGSKDFLIDEHQSNEVAMYFAKDNHFVITDKTAAEKASQEVRKSFNAGRKFATANFTKEGHFLQKTYPQFIVEVVDSMFEADTSKK
ncbi:hypothetical protein CRE_17215 [Caenorhabditis remanei]|uniref:AB hydrolase-1 domain-containing protein n=1 Tax=Caenorhabditis remanei TaxID=31234 RepID=E3MA45_CAERE|nr:hypothetical protein CRE_17215 [Caenorhabditis remanei]